MGYRIKTNAPSGRGMDEAEFLSRKDHFLIFVEENRKAVLGSLFFIVLVAGIGGFLMWQEHRKSQEAWVLDGQAQAVYLDRSVDDLDKSRASINKATDLYKQILKEYPRTTPAQIALYLLGNTLMEKEDYAGAIQSYEQFLEEYGRNTMLGGLVRQRLGYAFLLNGDRDKAVELFSTILGDPGVFNKDQVLFELAKLEESDNATDKALLRYKELLEKFPTSPYASEASLRIQVLSPEEQKPNESSEAEAIPKASQEPESTQSDEPEKSVESE